MHALKTLRKQSGLTLAELAEKSGASVSLISKFERGERNVSGKWVRILANALSVSENDIVGENVEPVSLAEGAPWFLTLQMHVADTSEMDRVIPRGSTIYIDPNSEMRDGWIYLLRMGSAFHVRRARLTNGPMRFEADSWSANYSPVYVEGQFAIVGRVRGLVNEI